MKNFILEILIFVIISSSLIIFIPAFYVNILCQWFPSLNYEAYGTIGDTIGGITGPIINLVGAYLVYVAFKAQIDANKKNDEHQYFNYMVEQINRFEDMYLESQINLMDICNSINNSIKNAEGKPYRSSKPNSSNPLKTSFTTIDLHKFEFLLRNIESIFIDIEPLNISRPSEKSLIRKFLSLYSIYESGYFREITISLNYWINNKYESEDNERIKIILECYDRITIKLTSMTKRFIPKS
ncbi:hypothetical protein [Flectobacillus roseus]|uniref:hypothetical protein n=1 Tax=Flectobacillus roseus TaxID=502259 RepID=UPI0024B69AA5|nr:hypothetical protein [Flectobacillus roseus]MDI9870027.1 hypothetical protein [Flectobacillus roseus]